MKKNLVFLLVVFMILAIGVPALLLASPQREANGASTPIGNWVKDAGGGFGDAANTEVSSLVEYNGSLYAGVTDATNGCEVFKKTDDGWVSASEPGFGNSKNMAIGKMAAYDGKLYAGTKNIDMTNVMSGTISQGCELYSYDGSTWTPVATGGFGDTDNIAVTSMAVHDDKLYIGVENIKVTITLFPFPFKITISSEGGSVFSYDGTTVTSVASGGFGNLENIAVSALEPFEGKLYAGTTNAKFTTSGFTTLTITIATEGCELYFYDGSSWTTVATEGITDAKNLAIKGMCRYDGKLCVGTVNLEVDELIVEIDLSIPSIEIIGFEYSTNGICIYSYDGTTMNTMVEGGFEGEEEVEVSSIETVTTGTKEFLLASVAKMAGAARLMVYDGVEALWYKGADDGFGSENNTKFVDMCTFEGEVFVGTTNEAEGCETWRGYPPLVPPAVVSSI
ncbi:MAG: hypothetical protein PHO53_03660, partial [Actinomycetota bacterium]|nr:hypothetical protein [Actinomycetota bacterium]